MRKAWALILVLSIFSTLVVGCSTETNSSSNISGSVNNTLKENEVPAVVNDNVQVIENAPSKEFYNNILQVNMTSEGAQVFDFSKLPKALDNLKPGEIVILEPTIDNPFGFIGKLESKKIESSITQVEFSAPAIDEVFKELKLDIDQTLNSKNVISFNGPKKGYQSVSKSP